MPLLSTFGAASFRGFGFGNLSGIEIPVDNLFNTVSFLSHFDGTNNGVNNVFDDSSTSNHTITANGDVTQGSFGPFARPDGEWAVAFPRPNLDNQSIYAAYNNADTAFGTGDFTVELFAFISVVPGIGDYANVFDFRTAGNTDHIDLFFGDNSKRLIYFAGGNTVFTSSTDLPIGEWVHLALVRSSGTTTLYQNGVSVGSASDSNNFLASIFGFGSRYTANYGMTGSISNARVVKGDAVYTSSFTPTTSPLTAITNTVFLSAQDNRFVDNSASAHTVGGVKSPSVSAFGPFLTSSVYDAGVNGASAYFDGAGDYLTAPDSDDFHLANGDYTIEGWFYVKPQIYKQSIIGSWSNTDRGWQARVEPNSGGLRMRFTWSNDGSIDYSEDGTIVFNYNEWNHLAWVKSGGTTTFYVNGVFDSSYNSSGHNIYNSSAALKIGDWDSNQADYDGYMSDVRLVKGTAVYTSAFTPPTAPLTTVTNTKLLLNMADGQAIDSAAQNNLTLVGNTKISSTQSKFGGTSIYFDGTGDEAKYSSRGFGTGDFTMEAWVYPESQLQRFPAVYYVTNGSTNRVAVAFDHESQPDKFRCNVAGTVLAPAGTNAENQWYHTAVVRYQGVVTFYINGTSVGSTSYTHDVAPEESFLGGNTPRSTELNFKGYIDDFRVSYTARYTSNFTPPTEPFADKGR